MSRSRFPVTPRCGTSTGTGCQVSAAGQVTLAATVRCWPALPRRAGALERSCRHDPSPRTPQSCLLRLLSLRPPRADVKPAPDVPSADLPTIERMTELLRRIEELETRLREARDEMEADKEEKALLSLRNKMLVEMLAVSQLDTGRAL